MRDASQRLRERRAAMAPNILLRHHHHLTHAGGNVLRRLRYDAALHHSVVRTLGRLNAKSWHRPFLARVVIEYDAPAPLPRLVAERDRAKGQTIVQPRPRWRKTSARDYLPSPL